MTFQPQMGMSNEERHEYRGASFSTFEVTKCGTCGAARMGFTSSSFSVPNAKGMAIGRVGGWAPEASREAVVEQMHRRIDEAIDEEASA